MTFESQDELNRDLHDGDDDGLFEGGHDGLDLTVAETSRRGLRDSTVAFGLILVVAAGALFGMRKLATQSLPTVEDSNVEREIEDALVKMFGPGESIDNTSGAGADVAISSLTLDRTDSQVPLEMVKKNPFIMWLEQPVNEGDVIDDAALAQQREQDLRRRSEMERQELELEVGRLTLTSVMGKGPGAVAVIDNQVVQVGDTVSKKFKVTKIEPLKVTLTAGELEYELDLDLF